MVPFALLKDNIDNMDCSALPLRLPKNFLLRLESFMDSVDGGCRRRRNIMLLMLFLLS